MENEAGSTSPPGSPPPGRSAFLVFLGSHLFSLTLAAVLTAGLAPSSAAAQAASSRSDTQSPERPAHGESSPAPSPTEKTSPTEQPGTGDRPTTSKAHTTGADAPARNPKSGAAQRSTEGEDPLIAVDDPMLEPVPPPNNVLHHWQNALARVRNRDPQLKRARAQIQAARGRARQALARALPKLTGNSNFNYHILRGQSTFNPNADNPIAMDPVPIPDPRWSLSGSLSLRVPLIDARSWYDHGTAKREIEQASLQAQDVERLVIGGLAESIVAVVTAERLAEVTRINLASALSSLELNKKRARLGAANAVDVLRAKREVTQTRAQLIQADESLRQARESLGLALGDSEAWGVTPEIKLDQLRADARSTCQRNEELEERADIKAAQKSVKIAKRNAQSVDYSYLPTLDAESRLYANSIPGATATRNGVTWTIGAVLTWTLYNGGQRYGEKTTHEALLQSAKMDRVDATRQAKIEVERALRGVSVAESRLKISRSTHEVAAQNARLARIRFVNGTGSSFDMIQTQSASQEARIDVTVKEFELLRAQIAAFLAMASCDI